jgi:hypothetical protein
MKDERKVVFSSVIFIVLIVCSGCGTQTASTSEVTEPPVIPSSPPVEALIVPSPTVKVIPTTVQEVPQEPTPPKHVLYPGEFSGKEQTIHDQISEAYASQKRAYGGDEYYDGRFERPFNQKMAYLGHLDIVKSTMIRTDPNFVFVTIEVAKPVASAINNPSYYGLELDLNLDGRSLFMIRGLAPLSEEWSTEGVDVWKSSSAEQRVSVASEGVIPVTGALGFDVPLLKSGRGADTDLAWMRMKPGTDNVVEIAFKHSIVGGEKGKFIWRPFTDGAPYSEREYDLQVNYTLEQAGSPYKGEPDYPLKDVFAVDNTCRVASGYQATGYEPGICPLSLPEAPQRSEAKPCVNPNGGPC